MDAAAPVFHSVTFSVMPSDSIMMIEAPASIAFLARSIRSPTSLAPSAASSASLESPPEPIWMPSSGLAFSPALVTFSTSRNRPEVGNMMKPVEISITSKPTSLASLR
ncbi:MAG: hypothetical protein R2719_14625 [Micropruina sp.]